MWGHDGRSGGWESSRAQTPRRLHRQKLVAWEQGQSLQNGEAGTHGTRCANVLVKAAALTGRRLRLCAQWRARVQASVVLASGWVVGAMVGVQCSVAPGHQQQTPDGGGGGWRTWRHSGLPAQYVSSRLRRRRGGAQSASTRLQLAAGARFWKRHRSADGGCEETRCRRGSAKLPGECYYLKKKNTIATHQPIVSTLYKNISTPTQWICGTFRFNHQIVGGMQYSLLFYITAVLWVAAKILKWILDHGHSLLFVACHTSISIIQTRVLRSIQHQKWI